MGLSVRDLDGSLKGSAASSRTMPSLQSHNASISVGNSKLKCSSLSARNVVSAPSSRASRVSPEQPFIEVKCTRHEECSVSNPAAQPSLPLGELGEEWQDWKHEEGRVEGGVDGGVDLSDTAVGSMNRSEISLGTERLSPPSGFEFQPDCPDYDAHGHQPSVRPPRTLTSTSSSRSPSPAGMRLPKLPSYSSSTTLQLETHQLPRLSFKQRMLLSKDASPSEGGSLT
jgi:hypothetical protein